jgi:hypothetical protein
MCCLARSLISVLRLSFSYMETSISALPTELWIAVFKEILHFPGRFDTSPLDPLASDQRSYTVSENDFSWNRQWNVILVSKQWCIICLPFLYEHVIIWHLEHLEVLASALDNLSVTSNISGCNINYGTRTRRMDILLGRLEVWTPNHFRHFETIRSLCPNVEIFCDPYSSLSTFIKHYEGTTNSRKPLRHVQWGPGGFPELCWTTEQLSKFYAIEVMMVEFGSSPPQYFNCNITLPHLHTLRVQGSQLHASTMAEYLRWMSHWDIPAISRLILSGGFFGLDSNAFFVAHGTKIKYLDIARVEVDYRVPRSLRPCVNLEHVVICDGLSLDYPPGLKRITVRTNVVSSSPHATLQTSYHVGNIIRDIERIPGRKPSSIRLVNVPWDVLKKAHFGDGMVKIWVEGFAALGVKLEDESGETVEAL